MTAGTLYAIKNARGMLPRALVEWLELDIELVNPSDKAEEFKSLFPLGKNPAYQGRDGFQLTEVIAVLYYLVNLKGDAELEKTFYGTTLEERSQVLRFLSYTNHEITQSTIAVVTAARSNAAQEHYDEKLSQCLACFGYLEKRLTEHEFLVDDQITIADLFTATICATLYGFALGKDKFGGFSKLSEWLSKVLQHPVLKGKVDTSTFVETTISLPPTK
ncbi:LADA_0F00166g1_1 [Lachancea dasiensis]|uniref:LADA_0F00166g1_1 n=1 Tax=Lachancea dasiensis TaxID=1072105 RepID=A0A1G4JHX2_9SACH|nr:LADA_0F00166g1_1 [Lachancea dasiensis]